MPIQMFAMITEVSAQAGEVSQLTGPMPTACRAELTMPESLLSIHDQVDADTISGSSHGTRNRARSVADSRKCWLKKTASASPMANWKTSDDDGEHHGVQQGRAERRVVEDGRGSCPGRVNGASPWTNERTV